MKEMDIGHPDVTIMLSTNVVRLVRLSATLIISTCKYEWFRSSDTNEFINPIIFLFLCSYLAVACVHKPHVYDVFNLKFAFTCLQRKIERGISKMSF